MGSKCEVEIGRNCVVIGASSVPNEHKALGFLISGIITFQPYESGKQPRYPLPSCLFHESQWDSANYPKSCIISPRWTTTLSEEHLELGSQDYGFNTESQAYPPTTWTKPCRKHFTTKLEDSEDRCSMLPPKLCSTAHLRQLTQSSFFRIDFPI